jgi:DNA polymerase elongation subunit (family B)
MNFYTNVAQYKSQILVRGYDNGKRFKEEVPYCPYLFVSSRKDSKYRTIDGSPVMKKQFESIYEAHQYYKTHNNVDGFNIYGLNQYAYTYIHDTFPNIKYDTNLIKTVVLDIEVSTDEKFPNIQEADCKITAITLLYNDIIFALGYGDFATKDNKVKYIRCKNEHDLLHKFIKIWSSELYSPDVVTGWNVELFDIPYCVNRISRVLGREFADMLSPWGILEERTVVSHGKENTAFTPIGVNVLDYFQLYKKFTYTQQESYKLDNICYVELGEKKLDYSEYESLAGLYRNDHQKFMEYNIRDCLLVKKLDDKMKLLDLVYTFAYDSGINFVDALTTVRTWDVIIHNYLLDRNIVIPQKKDNKADRIPVGGYVKDPQTGMHDWIVSFDLTSLYPHLIMGYNISPDTYRGKLDKIYSTEELLEGVNPDVQQYCIDKNLSFTANSCFYTREFQGFLPALMEELFNKRKEYKNKMLDLKKEYEKTKNLELQNEIAKYENLQMAAKIKLNSAYGALANTYFRWFDFNYAESITMSGQLTIRWAEKYLNAYLNKILKTDGIDYCIASDTDSVYLNFGPVVSKFGTTDKIEIIKTIDNLCEKKIQPILDKIYTDLSNQMNAYKQAMFMKREGISDRAIFIAKKRYITNLWNNEGIQYEKPKLKMMGIEAVRSSTPASCRLAIKNAIQVILTGTEDDAIKFINEFRDSFVTLPFEDVAFPRGVNGMDKYFDRENIYKKSTPIHVRGALLYNKLIKDRKLTDRFSEIFDKEKVKFCYLKMPNPLQENVISVPTVLPKQLELDKYIDYELQFEKAFLEPIKTILDVIGWQTEKKTTISTFFA